KVFARYTVREIFSTKRAEIAQIMETELRTRLAADGVTLRSIQIGKVDLPAEYRRGMDSLLAEELASEKMRYTLELKDKRVKETELDANADK
ncbi:SPFH domain-containing protein, partial [Veillonella parvula]